MRTVTIKFVGKTWNLKEVSPFVYVSLDRHEYLRYDDTDWRLSVYDFSCRAYSTVPRSFYSVIHKEV